jgi:peptide/nickel transport system permease protein
VALIEAETLVPVPPGGADPRRPPHRRRAALGGLTAIAGVVAVIVGTEVLTSSAGTWRIGLVLAGAAALLRGLSELGKAIRGERFDLMFWLSVTWLVLLVGAAVFADALPLRSSSDLIAALDEPSLARPDLFSAHPLGTDRQGLDILGGIIYGARVSLTIGVVAVAAGMFVGGAIGMLAGYFRGSLDRFVAVLTDSMLAFPPLILLLGLVAVLDPNVRNVTLALAVLGIPTYIRLARANTLVVAQREFVLAATALGARSRRIITREVLPNVALPVVSFGFLMVAVAIVAEASLSFLGLSVQRPNPTWGNMIALGQADFETSPHLVFAAGAVLFITIYSLNRVGDRAREAWDPRRSALAT